MNNQDNYYSKHYSMSVIHTADKLTLHKHTYSDWCDISVEYASSGKTDKICLRSKEITETLHFMLGQLLEKT